MENNGLIVRYLILPAEGDNEFTLSTPVMPLHNDLLFIYINRCYHLPDTSLFYIFALFQAPAGDFRAAGSSERGSGAALSPPRQSASPGPGSLTCLTAHLPQEKVKQAQTEAQQASQPPGSTI